MQYVENIKKDALWIGKLMDYNLKAKKQETWKKKIGSVLNPVGMMLLLAVIFRVVFQEKIDRFPVYFMCGMLIFGVFVLISKKVMNCARDYAEQMARDDKPAFLYPLAAAGVSMPQLLLYVLTLLVVILLTLTPIRYMVFFTVFPVMYTVLFAFGVGLILAAISVSFRGVAYLYEAVLMIGMFLTPVFYSGSLLPEAAYFWIRKNPLTVFIDMTRIYTLYQSVPPLIMHVKCWIACAAVLAVGAFLFHRRKRTFGLKL